MDLNNVKLNSTLNANITRSLAIQGVCNQCGQGIRWSRISRIGLSSCRGSLSCSYYDLGYHSSVSAHFLFHFQFSREEKKREKKKLRFSAQKIISPLGPQNMDRCNVSFNSVPLTYYSPQKNPWLAMTWSDIGVHFFLRKKLRRRKSFPVCCIFHLIFQYNNYFIWIVVMSIIVVVVDDSWALEDVGLGENFRLAVKAVIWKLHGLITPLIIYKVRAVSTVCAVTWFLFRWKEHVAQDLIKLRPHDEVS